MKSAKDELRKLIGPMSAMDFTEEEAKNYLIKRGHLKNAKREKCAAAGRELRQIQREHLREIAKGLKDALEALRAALTEHKLRDLKRFSLLTADAQAGTALEAARRLGL